MSELNIKQTVNCDVTENLLLHIETDYPDLAKEAKEQSINQDFSKYLISRKIFEYLVANPSRKISEYLVANPEEYYGKKVVSQALIKDAQIVARVVTVSNFVNFVFSSPVLYYSFNFLNPAFAVIATIASGLGVQAFSNSTAAAAVGRKSNNQVLPVIGAIGMLLTNTVLTIGSGVGAELIMNQNALAEKHAKTKAEEYITGLKNESQEKNSPYFSQYQEFSKKCDQGEEQLQNLEKDSPAANQLSPAANQLHLKLFGTYENRKELDDGKNFSPEDFSPEDASKLPTCYKAKVYEYYQKKYQKEYIQPKKVNYSKALETRNSWGNDTEFLKEIAPNIYGKDFIDEGPFENRFKNGSLAVEIALKNLFQKIADRNLSQLGFSLFLFSISAITSLIACLLAISLSYRSEFKDSHSDAAELEIDNWLEEQWDQLINKHRQEEQQLLQKNVLEENN